MTRNIITFAPKYHYIYSMDGLLEMDENMEAERSYDSEHHILHEDDVKQLKQMLSASYFKKVMIPIYDFQVGDFIICVDLDTVLDHGYGRNRPYEANKVCEITEVTDKAVYLKDEGYVLKVNVRPATPTEIKRSNENYSLPTINRIEGVYNEETEQIIYGCAKLNLEWFTNNDSRFILSMELSSEVKLTRDNIAKIRSYLIYKNILDKNGRKTSKSTHSI